MSVDQKKKKKKKKMMMIMTRLMKFPIVVLPMTMMTWTCSCCDGGGAMPGELLVCFVLSVVAAVGRQVLIQRRARVPVA